MKYCSNCGSENQSDSKFCVSCGENTGSITNKNNSEAVKTTNTYVNNQNSNQVKPSNHLVWGILTTVLCCLPFGIVSIVYATKVDTLFSSNKFEEAAKASKNAATWAIVAACSSLVLFVFLFYHYNCSWRVIIVF